MAPSQGWLARILAYPVRSTRSPRAHPLTAGTRPGRQSTVDVLRHDAGDGEGDRRDAPAGQEPRSPRKSGDPLRVAPAVDSKQLNVLIVSVQFPYPPRSGVNMRVYQLLRQVGRRHRVTLLSYALPDDAEGVAALREEMAVHTVERRTPPQWVKRFAQVRSLASATPFASREVESPQLQAALDALCARESFDVIQLEGSLLSGLRFPAGPALVLDEHNIEWEVFRRMCEGERSLLRRRFNQLEYMRFRKFEEAAWRQVHGCVVTSAREEPVVREVAPEIATAVVPNGVDVERFMPGGDPVEPRTVVFNGILDYRPNLDAAHYLVKDIWPRVCARCPDARLEIVGRARTAATSGLSGDGVELTGEVPDVRPHLQRAAVVAVPVRIGGGTRLKVVEGLALGKAIVSTSLGCEGIDVTDREHLLVADDADAFAARIVECFEDSALVQRLGAAARRLAEERYTWEISGDELDRLYGRLLRPADGRPQPHSSPPRTVPARPS